MVTLGGKGGAEFEGVSGTPEGVDGGGPLDKVPIVGAHDLGAGGGAMVDGGGGGGGEERGWVWGGARILDGVDEGEGDTGVLGKGHPEVPAFEEGARGAIPVETTAGERAGRKGGAWRGGKEVLGGEERRCLAGRKGGAWRGEREGEIDREMRRNPGNGREWGRYL